MHDDGHPPRHAKRRMQLIHRNHSSSVRTRATQNSYQELAGFFHLEDNALRKGIPHTQGDPDRSHMFVCEPTP